MTHAPSAASLAGRIWVLLLVLAGTSLAGPPAAPQPAAPPDVVRVVILHVNDSHGQTTARMEADKSVGGYARLTTLVRQVRAEKDVDKVLLLHAGDVLSRGDALTRRTLGAANVALMNAVGFDFWTPGNGEYYDGIDTLKDRIGEFRGKVLTSNVRLDGDKPLGQATAVVEAGPLKLGLFGLSLVRTGNRKGLTIDDAADAARREVAALRKQNVHAVVGLSHIGYDGDVSLARAVDGIDLMVGGHTHTKLETGRTVGGDNGKRTLVVQAGEYLRYLGRVDLTFRKTADGWTLAERTAKLIPVEQPTPFDPAIVELLKQMQRPNWKPGAPRRQREPVETAEPAAAGAAQP